jgi:cytoskeletal protein RodZ
VDALLRLVSLNAARVLFVGALLLTLYVGLTWALAVEDRPDAVSIAEAAAAREQAAAEASEAAAGDVSPEPTAPASEAPAPVATETISPEELIALARQPVETTVQVLDAGGGPATVDAVVSTLESLGYEVVAINASQRRVEATTVYYVGDYEPEAEAMRARDPRFQAIEPNQGLSEGVNLHVLVGGRF